MNSLGLYRGVRCVRGDCNGNLYDEYDEVKCSLCARWWDNLEDALADTSPQVGSTVVTPRLGYRIHHKPLTEEQRDEIRNSDETLRELAVTYKVTHSAIWKIKSGRW